MHPQKSERWRTVALIVSLLFAVAALGISIRTLNAAQTSRMPDWIEIQEGPVAFGIDKFYRNAYFKGNIETAGDLTVAGVVSATGTTTMTTAILDTLQWIEAGGGVITSTRTITPTSTFYQIDPDPSGDIEIALAACSTEGQPLIVYNALTRTVTISSTNVLPSDTVALSQYEIFRGLCNGTGWLRFPLSITGANGETLINAPDGEWDLGSANLETSGNITMTSLVGENGETFTNSPDGQWDFGAAGLTTTGDITTGATIDIGTWVNLSAQASLAVTEGGTITPTGTYQVITATTGVTTSLTTSIADGGETGDVLLFLNESTNVITITATGANVECKTDVALAVSDTLMLIWNGIDWNCLSNYDNS